MILEGTDDAMQQTYGLFLLIYILLIILKNEIREKIYINKACMKFEGVFNHLIKLHKERYKLYFSGDKEKIETYSEKIEFVGKKLLELGTPSIIVQNEKRMLQEAVDALNKIKRNDEKNKKVNDRSKTLVSCKKTKN